MDDTAVPTVHVHEGDELESQYVGTKKLYTLVWAFVMILSAELASLIKNFKLDERDQCGGVGVLVGCCVSAVVGCCVMDGCEDGCCRMTEEYMQKDGKR